MTTHPAFEKIASVITDAESGVQLRNLSTAEAGSSRNETIRFRVHAPLGRLTRTTTVYIQFLGIWVRGPSQTLEMGTYDTPGDAVLDFQMPKATVPASRLMYDRRFSVEVEYMAERVDGLLRREWDIEFTVVEPPYILGS